MSKYNEVPHSAVKQVMHRTEAAKEDSDFTYFFALLLAAEAIAKTAVAGIIASIGDDKNRNRYRLEHQLVRTDGLGDWGRALEDALHGPASQFLLLEARTEQSELTKLCKAGEWQHDSATKLKEALDSMGIDAEEVPIKSDMKRWFRLFATLRNKTRAHGAPQPEKTTVAAALLEESLELFLNNFKIFQRPWAHLHRNLNGKYRVSPITKDVSCFSFLKQIQDIKFPNGIYIHMGAPRRVNLIQSDPELKDFYFANGGFSGKKYELLSYYSDNKIDGDSSQFSTPPGVLPTSETEGFGELIPKHNCLTNSPDMIKDYIDRSQLQSELFDLLLDDKRPIITLLGRGGIGKTSLALKVLQDVYKTTRFDTVIWLSARDVDLQLSGPKSVRPTVFAPEDMAKFYAKLVLSPESIKEKGFNPTSFFEEQLRKSDGGPCLFVFDNFETTQNPIEVFNWIDTYIRLPNKALITTRLREFKGDYPVEVGGMNEHESKSLIKQTASYLGINELLDGDYINDIVARSEGHPYVIKIILGEISKIGRKSHIPKIVAGTEDILTALFERTYAALSPCSQRAFLTLSAWNSGVPRLALEAVLYRSTGERLEVEKGIDSLLQYSMAEHHISSVDKQDFISLPLVSSIFGKKKLNISPSKSAIQADVDILQMLGPTKRDDVNLALAKKLESFISNISQRIDSGESFANFSPILESICRAYNPGWLLISRWHMEQRTSNGYDKAKEALKRFLENSPPAQDAAEAWRLLGHCCYQTDDSLGEVHAFIERAQAVPVPFYDLSNTANSLNMLLREKGFEIDKEQKKDLASRLLFVLDQRIEEADADALSRMAWLSIHLEQDSVAIDYVRKGLGLEKENHHLNKLSQSLGINVN